MVVRREDEIAQPRLRGPAAMPASQRRQERKIFFYGSSVVEVVVNAAFLQDAFDVIVSHFLTEKGSMPTSAQASGAVNSK